MLKKMKRHRISVELVFTCVPEWELTAEAVKEELEEELGDYEVVKVKLLGSEEIEVERKRLYHILLDTVTGIEGPEWNCIWQAWSSDNYYACQRAANEFPDEFPIRDETGNRVPIVAYNNAGSPSGRLLLNRMKLLEMKEVKDYENENILQFLHNWGKKQVTAEGNPRFVIINEYGSEEPFN